MSAQRRKWAALAAGLVLLSGCAEDSKPKADDSASTDAANYVLLLDDDSDPDQVLGEPGSYALTARGPERHRSPSLTCRPVTRTSAPSPKPILTPSPSSSTNALDRPSASRHHHKR